MLRILLPLAALAALLLTPIVDDALTSAELGDQTRTLTGADYVGDTVKCWVDGKFSIDGACEPKGGMKGKAIFAAVFVCAVAAALGVIGLIPFLGRIVSAGTTMAGVVVIAAVAYFVLSQAGSAEGLEKVDWGSYVAGAGGLLTTIAGLAGMRGDRG